MVPSLQPSHTWPSPVCRTLPDKIQDIALKSPRDLLALSILVDLILARINADERPS